MQIGTAIKTGDGNNGVSLGEREGKFRVLLIDPNTDSPIIEYHDTVEEIEENVNPRLMGLMQFYNLLAGQMT